MGLHSVGLMVSEKIFQHFKSIEAYDSMASIDTRSMDCRIYVRDHKVRKNGKDQESIHDPGYQWGSDNFTHHKREPRGQPYSSR